MHALRVQLFTSLQGQARIPQDRFFAVVRDTLAHLDAARPTERVGPIGSLDGKPKFAILSGGRTLGTFYLRLLKGTGDGVNADLTFKIRWTDETIRSHSAQTSTTVGHLMHLLFGKMKGYDTYCLCLYSLLDKVEELGGTASVTTGEA
jgi:hypothetical protein